MRRFLIRTEDATALEERIEQEDITLTHISKHIPYVTAESRYDLEQLQELLPGYEIEEDKEYNAHDTDGHERIGE